MRIGRGRQKTGSATQGNSPAGRTDVDAGWNQADALADDLMRTGVTDAVIIKLQRFGDDITSPYHTIL